MPSRLMRDLLQTAIADMERVSAERHEEELDSRDGRGGVEGHARPRRNGTGRGDPAQGLLVREQRQAERPGTLIAPIQAGFEPGPLPSLESQLDGPTVGTGGDRASGVLTKGESKSTGDVESVNLDAAPGASGKAPGAFPFREPCD